MNSRAFAEGSYIYVPGVFQYSGGVAAAADHEIVRATLDRPASLNDGFARIEEHLTAAGRPRTALCACDLRSPAPYSEDGFKSFNDRYATILKSWGIYRQGINPVARTNVCPVITPPSEPEVYAFSYTRPARHGRPTFVVAGSGEVPEGKSNYRDHIIRPGDTTVEGLQQKVHFVLAAMEARLAALGVSWSEVTGSQIYTVHDIHPLLKEMFVKRGAARFGVTWHYARPPIAGLDFEMDCRGIATEIRI